MISTRDVLTRAAAFLALSLPALAVTFEVGPGKPHTTIQSAVNAGVALDNPAAANNTPPADPVVIVVFAGVYNEVVSIPAQVPARFNSQNDSWTIRANTGDRVVVVGGISVGIDRDFFTFDGINVNPVGTSGYTFAQTARSNKVRNCFIYGGNSTAVGFAAISQNRLFGTNTYEHLTIYDMDFGMVSSNSSTYILKDSIVAYSGTYGLGQFGGNANSPSYSNIFNTQNCNSGDIPPGLGICAEAYADGGNNVNYNLGADPIFTSVDPVNPDFLKLRPNSPCAGTGSSAGSFTNGQLNMGALPVAGAAAVIGACCYDNAECVDTTATGCPILPAGDYRGDGTACVSTNCTPPTGACCLPNGTCAELNAFDCAAQDGILQGLNTTCAVEGLVCSVTGACCTASETCLDTTQADCDNVQLGQYRGDGTACVDINCVRTLRVGPGQPYATIQAAVDAAVLFDDPGAMQDVPPFKPVEIVVYEGIYDEVVNIPADSAGQVFNGANDGWTIRAARIADTGKAVDDVVILRGVILVGVDREFFTFDGIHIMAAGNGQQDFGYNFVQTARSNLIRNCIIWNVKDNPSTGGDIHGNAVYNNRLFGTNTVDHVTMVACDNGLYARDNASLILRNSIIAFSTRDGLRGIANNGGPLDHTLIYNPPNLPPADPLVFEQPVNCSADFLFGTCIGDDPGSPNWQDGGNNVNWPLGAAVCDGGSNTCSGGPNTGQACASDADCLGDDPMFLSTDPTHPGFLRLDPASPARNAGSSAGAYTGGESTIGAFGVGVLPPEAVGACCLPDASCAQLSIFSCAAQDGVWGGMGVPCSAVDCTIGACCAINGTCSETTQPLCEAGNGTFQGLTTTCDVSNCPFIQPDPYADADLDGDVDADDFAVFQLCVTGSGGLVTPECAIYDRPEEGFPEGDGDVDADDFDKFVNCTSGPEVPADTSCDDPLPE